MIFTLINITRCNSLIANLTSGSNLSNFACVDTMMDGPTSRRHGNGLQQTIAILCVLIAFCSVYSNGYLIAGLHRVTRSGRLVRDVILLNMSVSDLLLSVGGAAFLAIALMMSGTEWSFVKGEYTLHGLSTAVCVTVNNLTMTSFLFERSVYYTLALIAQ